jgi:hypothetical protein
MICNKKCNYKDPELIIKTCFVEIQSAHPLSRKIVTPLSGAAPGILPTTSKFCPHRSTPHLLQHLAAVTCPSIKL